MLRPGINLDVCCLGRVTAEVEHPASCGSASSGSRRQLCGGTQAAVEKMLAFGRELHSMSECLKRDFGTNETNKKTLRVWKSPTLLSDPGYLQISLT